MTTTIQKFHNYELGGNTFAHKDAIKAIGGSWDKASKTWTVSVGGMRDKSQKSWALEKLARAGVRVSDLGRNV